MILEEVISSLHPEDVPPEYIILAKVVDVYGTEKTLRGVDLEKFMNNPDRGRSFMEARVFLDVRKIRDKITNSVNSFFDELKSRTDNIFP